MSAAGLCLGGEIFFTFVGETANIKPKYRIMEARKRTQPVPLRLPRRMDWESIMNHTKAVLVVSFGTSQLDTLEKNISAIEQEISRAMPEYTLRRAFTSGAIMKKLRQEDGIKIDTVQQALEKLEQEGFSRIVIQPTYVMSGEQYTKLCRQTKPFLERMNISIGTPLLTSVQDYKDTLSAMMGAMEPPCEDEAIVFMGHGTAHGANAAYALLDNMLRDFGWERAFVGTVEGYPELPQVIDRLRRLPQVKRVRLHPLMVVAGNHAKNDMAGMEEDSWQSLLRQEGYEVSCVLRGLGEYEPVRRLFAQHALSAGSAL